MLHIILMHISHCIFFLLMTLLAVYFIFILDYKNDVKQKANLTAFFHSSAKCVIRQWRQLTTSTMHLAWKLLINI